MNRIEQTFKELRAENKKAFIAFITAGYPGLEATAALIREFDRIGVDIVELGVPFSDPLADGPIIQEASQDALKRNVHPADIIRMVKNVRKDVSIPICLMTYYNPVFCFGEEKFVKEAQAAGVDGIIVPDLPPDEGRSLMRLSREHGLDMICFLAPTSTPERVDYIASVSRGFIYYVSLIGVTGPRSRLPDDLIGHVKAIKKATGKPVCVGFGVSTPQQVRQIHRIADGVIVGSAIVAAIKEYKDSPDMVARVGKFVQRLKGQAAESHV